MPRENITGRNTTSNGLHLNTGLGTMADFNLVTAVENKELSCNVRMRYSASSSSSNDYFSAYNHSPQFTTSAGAILVSGNKYENKFAAIHSQFIAPYDCILKSVDGYISPAGFSSCEIEQNITISVWSKSVTVGGTATTDMTLLFSQTFNFAIGSGNQYALQIDGTTDSKVNNSTYLINDKESVIVSVKRAEGDEPCGNFTASFNMVFKSNNSQATSDDFKLNTISVANNRYDNTVSNPDKSYIPLQS